MLTKTHRSLAVFAATVMVLALTMSPSAPTSAQQAGTLKAPSFELDPKWPTIPNNWVLGEVSSIAVDSRDHVWVLQNGANSMTQPTEMGTGTNPPTAERCCSAAPPVLEFDAGGALVSNWGGPADGARRVLGAVRSYRDLETPLIGAVERLIDFVTVGDACP